MREIGPSPNPSTEGKGRDDRDTPMEREYASFYPLISSPIGVTSHTTEGVSKCTHPLFYAQSPDFLKPGLCYFLKFLYL